MSLSEKEVKTKKPLISVIMSVYNEEKYLKESIESVLNQTLRDFEVIIVDDCSTDRTFEIIESFQDARIRLIRNEVNQGLTKNLNKALEYCRGKYIARMDGDDICFPKRFEKQVAYMEKNPAYMLSGCQTRTFGEQNMVWRLKDDPDVLRIMMLIRPVLAHPTFMMRRELIFEHGFRYDESFRSAQDYDFAQRVSEQFPVGIVQEVLLNYRTHKKQVSSKSSGEQYNNADRVRERQLEQLEIELDAEMREVYQDWIKEATIHDNRAICLTKKLITLICQTNAEKKIYCKEKMYNTLMRMLIAWILHEKSGNCLKKMSCACEKLEDWALMVQVVWEIGWNKLKVVR